MASKQLASRPETERRGDSTITPELEEKPTPDLRDTALSHTRGFDPVGQPVQRAPTRDTHVIGRQDAQATRPREHGRGDAPAVRLDMDLDVDINLRAKIQGKVELSIL